MPTDGWHGLYVQGGVVRGSITPTVDGGWEYRVMSAHREDGYSGHHAKLETVMWEVEGGVQGQDGRARERKAREG